MDPITQGLLGAAAAQAACGKSLGRRAAVVGFIGGTLADADVFLSAWSDPAHPQELHRHFTHALAFIPVGGLIAATPFFVKRWYRDRARAVLWAATLAYATHGLLDCMTSYGTHWLWPFTDARSSWDVISIIDPVFTGVLLVALMAAMILKRSKPAAVGLMMVCAYLGWGVIQHARASAAIARVAAYRGHGVERIRAMPTLGNLIVWRGLYVSHGSIYVVAVRTPVFAASTVREGGAAEVFVPRSLPASTPQRQHVVDVLERFNLFADGYLTKIYSGSNLIIADLRYSLDSAGLTPLWGIRLDPVDPDDPLAWGSFGVDRRRALRLLRDEVLGRREGFHPLPARLPIPPTDPPPR